MFRYQNKAISVMNKFLLLVLTLVSYFEIYSQAEIWNKVKLVDNALGVFAVTDIIVDNFDNKYVANLSIDDADNEKDKYGMSISKYNKKNELIWKNKFIWWKRFSLQRSFFLNLQPHKQMPAKL